ncbi:MAG: hypothetical protein HY690_09715 [Chloroflexi bacterium]|nr:hypothetical protein [Chloroflexota bacterium]
MSNADSGTAAARRFRTGGNGRLRLPGLWAGPALALLALVLSAQPLLAFQSDVKTLAVPVSHLGPGWTLVAENVGTTVDLGQSYTGQYVNNFTERFAIFMVVQLPNAAVAELSMASARQQGSEGEMGSQPWPSLGDGGGVAYAIEQDDAFLSVFAFRVDNVVAIVMAGGPTEQAADVRGLALGYTVLQHDRLRAALQGALSPTDAPPTYPYCGPGQTPRFQSGFAMLQEQLGSKMGLPRECEHSNPDNGDALQKTSTGLSIYRKSTNTPTFTNGSEHWALTPEGPLYWAGASVDPPAGAQAGLQP